MRAHDLNTARRLGKAHGHSARDHVTPFAAGPLRRRYWKAREQAETRGTIFVWHDLQRVPAALYAAAHMPRALVVVSADPTIQNDRRRNIVRYHHA